MAEMTKKLHFLKNGTEQTAKAYSTTAEAGSSYITNVIDNTTCYIPIGSTSDSRATYGRVLKGGTTYAILSQAKPAYAEKSWTSPGTYTWTAPAGVTRVRVAVCGGGAGGLWMYELTPDKYWSKAGGNSSFGNLVNATGSPGSYIEGSSDSEGYYVDRGISYNGSPNGRIGQVEIKYLNFPSTVSGGAGFALSFTLANGSYGRGGNVPITNRHAAQGGAVGGGSGGYNTGYVNVTAGTTYTIVVGAGGAAYTTYPSRCQPTNGNSGFVLIAFGGNI